MHKNALQIHTIKQLAKTTCLSNSEIFFSYFPLVFILNSSPLDFFVVGGVNAIVIMFGVLLRTKQSFTSYSFRANKMVLILAAKPKELSLTSHG